MHIAQFVEDAVGAVKAAGHEIESHVNVAALEKVAVDAYASGGRNAVLPALVANVGAFASDPGVAAAIHLALTLASGAGAL